MCLCELEKKEALGVGHLSFNYWMDDQQNLVWDDGECGNKVS
jgi:hypothetical protein